MQMEMLVGGAGIFNTKRAESHAKSKAEMQIQERKGKCVASINGGAKHPTGPALDVCADFFPENSGFVLKAWANRGRAKWQEGKKDR